MKLLEDIRGVFQGERMATKDLLNALREEEESPWAYSYYRKHFEDAWDRYLPETVTSVTSVTYPPDLTIL